MGNKRGSHVGMMLSFMFFVMFVVFMYVLLAPQIIEKPEKKSTLEYVEMKIMENVSSKLTSGSVKIDSSAGDARCLNLEKLTVLLHLDPPYSFIVKNEFNEPQTAYVSSENSSYLEINRTNPSQLFFQIYASPHFNETPVLAVTPCTLKTYGLEAETQEYNISTIRRGNYLFEQRIEDLANYYNNYYSDLKDEFEIPAGDEFGFSFERTDGTKIVAQQQIFSKNVYADEIPIQYVDKSANIQVGFINIKIW